MPEPPRRRVGRPPLHGSEVDRSPLTDLDDDERRDLFLVAAAALFERKGYASTSVNDIAAELGFTKGVYYYYWKNKREILHEIHNRGLQTLEDRLAAVEASDMPPAERLHAAIDNHVEGVLQNRSVIAVLLGDVALHPETVERRRTYADHFQKLINDAVAADEVHHIDTRVLTFMVLGLCNSVARWYRPDGRLPAEQIRELFTSFAMHGWAGLTTTTSGNDDVG